MVDQNSQFYAILTKVGAAKQANADALGIPWTITQMAVGDGNPGNVESPALPLPTETWTALLNEWRRAPLNQLKVDPNDSSIIVAEQVIPADVGGRWIREIGLYDSDGDLVAVANCAPTYKPLLSQGSGRTQVVRLNLIVSSSSNVQLKIDPSVVLATREWVAEELAKQDFKHSVLVATTAAITLSGLQTIDGVALTAGARVLVKNQPAAKDNGLYLVVAGGTWTRCTDADSSAKVTPGLLVLVERGTVNADSAWQLLTDAPITLGTTALDFVMAFGRTGVAAGTYRSVQVDAYGRVVAATNPTTVAGYGLTDVYTKTQLDDALSLKAPKDSPTFTGDPKAPTPATTDNDTSIATTGFVRSLMSRYGLGSASTENVITNIDAISETGVYMVTGTTLGVKPEYPPQQGTGAIPNGTVLHLERWSNNMATQFWDSLVNAIEPITCIRTRNANGVWTAWKEIITAGHLPFRGTQVFKTAGVSTWTVPTGVKKAWVTVIGAGGGGGFAAAGGIGSGGGGGGGLSQRLVDLTGISSVLVTVGAGGAGASVSGGAGGTGGSSSFGAYLSATGGAGGGGNNPNGNAPGAGGRGAGGDFNTSLGAGSPNYGMYGGNGGGPGPRSTQASTGGGDAADPGGGGPGAYTGNAGGAGAPGCVTIQW